MKLLITIMFACLFLTACASGPHKPKHIIETKDGRVVGTNKQFVTTTGKNSSKKRKDDVLSCRMERTVGSHIQKYVCMTEEERAKQAENSRWTWHKATKCGTGSNSSDDRRGC